MKWLRYKHKWAWGESSSFDYIRYYGKEDDQSIREFIEDAELCKENQWSDKYRGISYELVDRPEGEWITREIDKASRVIEVWTRYKDKLESLL